MENKKRFCGRPEVTDSEKLVCVRGSIELYKFESLKSSADKKANEKEIREFVRFITNFTYTVGSYEKAMQRIKEIYEINNTSDKQ